MLFLDGVYAGETPSPRFVHVPAPSPMELQGLVQTLAERIGRSLERAGLITRDAASCYVVFDPSEEASINTLLGTRSPIGSRPVPVRDTRSSHCKRSRRTRNAEVASLTSEHRREASDGHAPRAHLPRQPLLESASLADDPPPQGG
jgi:hypothetical protein